MPCYTGTIHSKSRWKA